MQERRLWLGANAQIRDSRHRSDKPIWQSLSDRRLGPRDRGHIPLLPRRRKYQVCVKSTLTKLGKCKMRTLEMRFGRKRTDREAAFEIPLLFASPSLIKVVLRKTERRGEGMDLKGAERACHF